MSNNRTFSNSSFLSADPLWRAPIRIDVIETPDSIEFMYKQTYMLSNLACTPNSYQTPQERVFKIVFSCVDGKWNKSERVYGKILPAEGERYVFGID